ncbi:uncharacterized protein LOC143180191 [Calliopsis andreniformis]|uniref:uncharacterized protein LOC143180191 n=1 Tax=Calliopsis andreniformis TaxID=337506 RepID=UPI003FCC2A95
MTHIAPKICRIVVRCARISIEYIQVAIAAVHVSTKTRVSTVDSVQCRRARDRNTQTLSGALGRDRFAGTGSENIGIFLFVLEVCDAAKPAQPVRRKQVNMTRFRTSPRRFTKAGQRC